MVGLALFKRCIPLENLRIVERLVGRRRELGALVGLLGEAWAGRGRGLVLLGDAGIGKTALAEALAREARGWTVSWGRCPEVEAVPGGRGGVVLAVAAGAAAT